MVYEFDNNVLLVHMRLFILVPVIFCKDSLMFVLRYILETTVHVLYVHTAYICTQYTVQYYYVNDYYLVIDCKLS